MQRTDGQGIGTPFAGCPGQVFQGQGIAEATIAGTLQAVELGAQAPGPGCPGIGGVSHAVAGGGGDGQGEMLAFDAHGLVADRHQAWQHRVLVQSQIEYRTVFQMNLTRCIGAEVAGQVQPLAEVRCQQRRQVLVLLHPLQFQQAAFNGRIVIGRMAETGQDLAQDLGPDLLRPAIGIDPVNGQARSARKNFQLRIVHRDSPSRDDKSSSLLRLTRAQ